MLKTEVNIERTVPSWAQNYLDSHELFFLIGELTKSKRHQSLPKVLREIKKTDLLDVIYCNAKGNVVFKWETAQEKTMFMLKWG